MTRKILVADLLCGAGGSSTGCERALSALGLKMELVCVNHWPIAIETHKKNHPQARHYVQDIATVRPHILVPEGYLDLLMASPTCTHHSVARGGKPTSDQQRSDPWHIITWLTELRVHRLLIENVWEFTKWGPVDPKTMRPIKEREGEYFDAWITALRGLRFDPQWRKQNAANFGVPQTRQRMMLLARSDQRRLVWPGASHQRVVDSLALFPTVKPWRPARDCIDWTIKGRSIFRRPKPLAWKTLDRILAGALKFGWDAGYIRRLLPELDRSLIDAIRAEFSLRHAGLKHRARILVATRRLKRLRREPVLCRPIGQSEPIIITLRRNADGRSIDLPVPALAANGQHIGLAQPMVLSPQTSGRARSVDEPFSTITTGGSAADHHPGCARHALATAFVLSRHGEGAPRSVEEPTPTQVARHSHILVAPYYGSGSGETCTSIDEPLPTVTAKPRFGMVVPITHTDGASRARDVESDPMPTITTANRGELAFITAQFGERPGQAPRVHSIDDPAPAICATGHINLVECVEAAAEDDCRYDIHYRMFEANELAAASSFPKGYLFAGTKTDQVKQIGNAVPPLMAEAHVLSIMADAAPKARRVKASAAPRPPRETPSAVAA